MASGFAYGRNGGGLVLRTTDGGAKWTPVKVGSRDNAGFGSLAFTPDRKVVFVISSQEGLFRSRDGGTSWMVSKIPGLAIFKDKKEGWAICGESSPSANSDVGLG